MNTTTTKDMPPSITNTSRPSARGAIIAGKKIEYWKADEASLHQPLQWSRPRMIFVCAHGDLFHESVPDDWIDRVFAVMALAKKHTFQVLTKRPERMQAYLEGLKHPPRGFNVLLAAKKSGANLSDLTDLGCALSRLPLPNVWLGTSVEDQATADKRIPHLLATPAAVRFLSCEPMLGPIDLTDLTRPAVGGTHHYSALDCDGDPEDDGDWHGATISWVICGGESGKNARPMHPDWARSTRDQCQQAAVPFFFKQWGQWLHEDQQDADGFDWADAAERGLIHAWPDQSDSIRLHKSNAGRLLDGREWNEMPRARK